MPMAAQLAIVGSGTAMGIVHVNCWRSACTSWHDAHHSFKLRVHPSPSEGREDCPYPPPAPPTHTDARKFAFVRRSLRQDNLL